MSDLKMGVLDECNDSPVSSADSFSGYYRNLRMSYDAMVEARRLERKLKLALEVIEKLRKSNDDLDSSLTKYLDAEDIGAKRTCDKEAILNIELVRQAQKEVSEMIARLK